LIDFLYKHISIGIDIDIERERETDREREREREIRLYRYNGVHPFPRSLNSFVESPDAYVRSVLAAAKHAPELIHMLRLQVY